jgi:hypothetical protein
MTQQPHVTVHSSSDTISADEGVEISTRAAAPVVQKGKRRAARIGDRYWHRRKKRTAEQSLRRNNHRKESPMTRPPQVTIHHTSDAAPVVQKGKRRDARGRMIEAHPLDALETYRLMKLTKAEGGEGFFGMAAMACSVRSIDGDAELGFSSEMELEALIQRLGNEGLAAVGAALGDFNKEEIGAAPKT